MAMLVSILVIILGWIMIRYGLGFVIGGFTSLLGSIGLSKSDGEKSE